MLSPPHGETSAEFGTRSPRWAAVWVIDVDNIDVDNTLSEPSSTTELQVGGDPWLDPMEYHRPSRSSDRWHEQEDSGDGRDESGNDQQERSQHEHASVGNHLGRLIAAVDYSIERRLDEPNAASLEQENTGGRGQDERDDRGSEPEGGGGLCQNKQFCHRKTEDHDSGTGEHGPPVYRAPSRARPRRILRSVTEDRPPSVDRLARSLSDIDLPQPLLVDAARQAIADGSPDSARDLALGLERLLLQPVINATGVLLHTNLGRAPLAHHGEATAQNLELDLATGKRGSRQSGVGLLLARACGAEAALVVNNCSAALMLALAALAAGRSVSVSRGELVEIGGGFRVPDVMAQSGAQLVEVGTTNRTRLDDFRRAADQHDIALSLHVHQSNYTITGFTEATSVAELATLDAPVVADIGSGLLDAACPWLDGPPPSWLANEPAAKQTLEAGASLVVFSGDKLLGGPQAGVIAGSTEMVQRCARHPLARAVRPGGMVLSAMQDTALAYLQRDGQSIPFWRMATATTASLRERAEAIAARSGARCQVIDTEAVPGGGTLPTVTIPSVGIRIAGDHLDALRSLPLPIIARVDDHGTTIDFRSVDPSVDDLIGAALESIVGA